MEEPEIKPRHPGCKAHALDLYDTLSEGRLRETHLEKRLVSLLGEKKLPRPRGGAVI